jgi:hypothetical protein
MSVSLLKADFFHGELSNAYSGNTATTVSPLWKNGINFYPLINCLINKHIN